MIFLKKISWIYNGAYDNQPCSVHEFCFKRSMSLAYICLGEYNIWKKKVGVCWKRDTSQCMLSTWHTYSKEVVVMIQENQLLARMHHVEAYILLGWWARTYIVKLNIECALLCWIKHKAAWEREILKSYCMCFVYAVTARGLE